MSHGRSVAWGIGALLAGCGGTVTTEIPAGEGGTGGVPSGGVPAGGAPTGGVFTGGTPAGGSGGVVPACPAGLVLCGGVCVDIASSASNCGACGVTCSAAVVCSAGQCLSDDCPGGIFCSGTCVDPASSPQHCGACGNACPAGMDCFAGTCGCAAAGQTWCDGRCVDLLSDSTHCGACGNVCETGWCMGGACVTGTEPPSCAAGLWCGGESCCASIQVPGGTFPMGRSTNGSDAATCSTCSSTEEPEHPALVQAFHLDKFEVTVGRFRAFVQGYEGWRAVGLPTVGQGRHPLIDGSGWTLEYDALLPNDQTELVSRLECDPEKQTWTAAAGVGEAFPINCVSWHVAFAFCIFDGGRLPTEAEWEFAAAGGDENRLYPWGPDTIRPLPANHVENHNTPYLVVGSEPGGNGRWGHADLGGSMWEWVLDSQGYYSPEVCDNCANLAPTSNRALRGGCFANPADQGGLRGARRFEWEATYAQNTRGMRCARDGL